MEVAAARVHGADGVANLSRVEQIEIDERKHVSRSAFVSLNADLLRLAGPAGNWRGMRGWKKPGTPKAAVIAALVSLKRRRLASSPRPATLTAGSMFAPELLSRSRAAKADCADDRAIDRRQSNAGHPVDFEVGSLQRVIGAGLIGAESAASCSTSAIFSLRVSAMAPKWVGDKGVLDLDPEFNILQSRPCRFQRIFVQSAATRQGLARAGFARASFVSRAPFIAMQ